MITLTNDLKEAGFVTHAGNFHADDIFSTVFMEKVFGSIKLIRLKEYLDNDTTKIAYDIGLGKFDHHGCDYDEKRENGIHYCSFGLLWKEFGLEYLKKNKVIDPLETFKIFDYLLVNSIDAFDNGEYEITSDFNIYTISSLIEVFRPKKGEDENECFLRAIQIGRMLFDRILNEATEKVKNILEIKKRIPKIKDKVLVLDEFIPYEYAIFYLNLDINFVIYPSNRGGFAVHTVPKVYKGFSSKIPFKKEWGGLRDESLQKVSGIKTARFCHNKLFLVVTDTLEDALEFVKKTIT